MRLITSINWLYVLTLIIITTGISANNGKIVFCQNKGQVADEHGKSNPNVLFGGKSGDLVFHLKRNGVSYQLNKVLKYRNCDFSKLSSSLSGEAIVPSLVPATTRVCRVDMEWLGANQSTEVVGNLVCPGYDNFYLSNCPDGAVDVRSYRSVFYRNIYKGIDVSFYEHDGCLKYDYIVHPGSNYKSIKIKVNGGKVRKQKDGSIRIITVNGIITEGVPVVYQENKVIPSQWMLNDDVLTFVIGDLDASKSFTIDPSVRSWGTYYGGHQEDHGFDCEVDGQGNVFLSGATMSSGSLIATSGSYQYLLGGSTDAFISKFDSLGNRQWGTYYGGATASEIVYACKSDKDNNIYIVGEVKGVPSAAVICSSNAHQNYFGGGFIDAFIAKFNSAGHRIWGTFYGGNGGDFPWGCNVDRSGNFYVVGKSWSTDNISTSSAYQISNGGSFDGFIAKFDSTGTRLWGTYYGGTSDDEFYDCVLDSAFNLYLVGSSGIHTPVITTPGSHKPINNGSTEDAILVKFDANGSRVWGTYYGGTWPDYGLSCDLDSKGDIYIAGTCEWGSNTGISTLGSHQVTHGGMTDLFLAKFSSSGTRLWGTYFGGAGIETEASCAVDDYGYVYLAGTAQFSNTSGISTLNAHQVAFGGGLRDKFFAKVAPSGALISGTYYGGNGDEHFGTCSTGPNGAIYLCGYSRTPSGTAIATANSHQPHPGTTQNTTGDAFLAKFYDCDVGPPIIDSFNTTTVVCAGQSVTLQASATGSITWYDSQNNFLSSGPVYSDSALAVGIHTFYLDVQTCRNSSKTSVTVTVNPLPDVKAKNYFVCLGDSIHVQPTGAATFTISGNRFVLSPTVTSTYSVIGTESTGCVSGSSTIFTVSVGSLPNLTVSAGVQTICLGDECEITVTGATSYTWNNGYHTSGILIRPVNTTTLQVTGRNNDGCIGTETISVIIEPCTSTTDFGNESYYRFTNPVSEVLNIVAPLACKYSLISGLGGVISEGMLMQGTTSISVINLPPGMYTLILNSGSDIRCFLVIKI